MRVHRLAPSDFVLTDAGPIYVENFSYPQRQIIPLSKLTAPPMLLPRSTVRGEDLVFVSNNSRTPEALLDGLLSIARDDKHEKAFVIECWRRLVDMYAGGESLPAYRDVCEFLRNLIAEMGDACQ